MRNEQPSLSGQRRSRLMKTIRQGGDNALVAARSLFAVLKRFQRVKPGVDITRILEAMHRGDPQASEELMTQIYQELRHLAAHKMAGEAPGHTLQATALVHEAWLRLTGSDNRPFENRAHFFAAAGEAMRRILVENARRKKRLKRGGDRQRVDLDAFELPAPMPDEELLALDEALTSLTQIDARAAELVKLCFFVGLTQEQAAKELGVSISTVERTWAYAKAWLFRELQKHEASPVKPA